MESVKAWQSVSTTFFANKNYPNLALQTLQKRTRDEMTHFTSSSTPAKFIFMEGENNLVNDVCEITGDALMGNSWLVVICREVDRLIEAAQKKYADRFSLSDVLGALMRPPFGFFNNQPHYAILGYALRKHKDNLFNPSTSQPVGDEKLKEMIEALLKMWGDGINESNSKLLLRFGSVEERNLTSILGEVFNLSIVKGVSMSDLKSLTYAKWSITEFCKQIAKYPLWSLLYCEDIKSKPNCKKAISDLINLFNQDSYQLAKIKELLHEIKSDQIDLYKLLAKPANYREGFINFINNIKEVELQPEWWDELEEELSHLQSEIAFRREEDVRSCVMSFYINKIKKPTPSPVPEGVAEPFGPVDSPAPATPQPAPDEIKQAKNLVKESNMPTSMWKMFVLEIIDEHPEISKFISDYLGS